MNDLISLLEKNQGVFEPVVPFDPVKNKLLLMDFTAANSELKEDVLSDTRSFCNYINNKLENRTARYGMVMVNTGKYIVKVKYSMRKFRVKSHDDYIWVWIYGANPVRP